ncbi:ABC transporter ATP-binding protein [Vulcanimicrobium alpinum]|uniref:ABC transporter ATP-binding protein n=1 Tax=Vulcanimicrobium alpinum TaxID=3016050 RepID=A0AAN2CAN9_UNVUL|nr:ABC transporter ATP-binding protein [Vulcanimicrobium alpinum]BDE07875.1 ABC transporter ATP-binding protein [Vulcanimicrobium alpinum]
MSEGLEVRGLQVRYGSAAPALDRVDLQVRPGECVTLLGANGSGKSTLFCALSGIVPSSGTIAFDGRDTRRMRPAAIVQLGIAQCAEGRKLFPELSVEKNLRLGAYVRRNRREADASLERVCALFPDVRMKLRAPAGSLSGGQQQMVAIGRALMAKPKLLLLDEPSLGLAPRVVTSMLEAIAQINRDGTMVLIAEQNAYAALAIAQRGYVLAQGRVVLEGSASTLRDNELVKKAFIGA